MSSLLSLPLKLVFNLTDWFHQWGVGVLSSRSLWKAKSGLHPRTCWFLHHPRITKRSLADTEGSEGPGLWTVLGQVPVVSSIIPHCLPQTEKRDFPPIKSREAVQVCVNSCFHRFQQLNLVVKTAHSQKTVCYNQEWAVLKTGHSVQRQNRSPKHRFMSS